MKCVIIVVHFIHYSVGMKLVKYLFNLLLCLKYPYRKLDQIMGIPGDRAFILFNSLEGNTCKLTEVQGQK